MARGRRRPKPPINQDSPPVGPSALNISQPVSETECSYPTKLRSVHAIRSPTEDGLEFIWLRHDLLDINRLAKIEMWMHISTETVLHTKRTAVAVPFAL